MEKSAKGRRQRKNFCSAIKSRTEIKNQEWKLAGQPHEMGVGNSATAIAIANPPKKTTHLPTQGKPPTTQAAVQPPPVHHPLLGVAVGYLPFAKDAGRRKQKDAARSVSRLDQKLQTGLMG